MEVYIDNIWGSASGNGQERYRIHGHTFNIYTGEGLNFNIRIFLLKGMNNRQVSLDKRHGFIGSGMCKSLRVMSSSTTATLPLALQRRKNHSYIDEELKHLCSPVPCYVLLLPLLRKDSLLIQRTMGIEPT